MSAKGNKTERIWNTILATLGITATGLIFGLHRLLWRIWIVLSLIWVIGLFLLLNLSETRFEPVVWVLIFGPPMILLLVAWVLSWIIKGLQADMDEKKSK